MSFEKLIDALAMASTDGDVDALREVRKQAKIVANNATKEVSRLCLLVRSSAFARIQGVQLRLDGQINAAWDFEEQANADENAALAIYVVLVNEREEVGAA